MQQIEQYLAGEKYLFELAHNYHQALEKLECYTYDCVILDLMLPGGDGLHILEYLKKQNRQEGVIIISAKNSLDDKIKGLLIGADDYLAKPFHMAELAARIFSIIRRKQFNSENKIVLNDLEIDILLKQVYVHKTPISLTKKEFELLLFFIGNKNKLISKNAIAEHLSGDIADIFDDYDFVYAHIKNLKKKLAEAGFQLPLKTIYGMGYKWEE